VLEEDVTRPGRDLPPDHVRVEQVPVGAWAHEGALLLPSAHQSLVRQDLHRLAKRGETQVEFLAEFGQVDRLPFSDPSGEHSFPQQTHRLAVHATPRIGGHHFLRSRRPVTTTPCRYSTLRPPAGSPR